MLVVRARAEDEVLDRVDADVLLVVVDPVARVSAERLITEKKTPMLFMYGEEKRNKFHTDKIVELVRATPGCKVVPVADAGHWLYHESQQAELCFREVKAFVLGK